MKKNVKILICLVIVVAAIGVFINFNQAPSNAIQSCVQKCKDELKSGTDLSNGPCLSNNISPGWICDVAHNPRTDVDNKPENQCPEYGKSANHFVEVDSSCNFIRSA